MPLAASRDTDSGSVGDDALMVRRFLSLIRERIRCFLAIYEVDEAIAAEFRVQQIGAIQRLTPLTIVANLFNAAVIAITFRHSESLTVLTLWVVAVAMMMVLAGRAWLRTRRGQAPRRVSSRALLRATVHATILAALWAVPPAVFYTRDSIDAALVTAIITAGMLCAGGFALLTVPSAAVSYVLILVLGSVAGLVRDDIGRNLDILALLGVYSMIVIASVAASSRTYSALLMAEAEAERQRQLVGLLLHDFEEHSSDWLWETDAHGVLVHASSRLAQTLETTPEQLRNQRLVHLLAFDEFASDSEEVGSLLHFVRCLEQAQPFRDVPVAVRTREGLRWWALTAKPLFDERGVHCGWRGVGSDVTESRCAALEMSRLANYDSLTRLANRHLFRQELDRVAAPDGGPAAECALFLFDLDDFKIVNDSLGHAAGDRVLQAVGQRLAARIRPADVLARLGGDEFALIGWGVRSPEQAVALAEHLLDVFRDPFDIEGMSVQVASSVGISLAPAHSSDPETLLRNADMALYAAKLAGRNTWRFFEPAMAERARDRLALRNDLVAAIARDELELHYQPQVSMDDGRVCGFEALLRWNHPGRGRVSAAQFVPLAEETGLILEVGRWVLRTACRTAANWPAEWRVAVNVSAVQFARADMIAEVGAALALSGLPAARLELEITESVLIGDSVLALKTLSRLRELGVRIALDDFGTGYSSLAYLRNFPLTKLKIDRSFVTGITAEGGGTEAIVRAIIALADALNLETTAEGVETEAEHEALREQGCTFGQGYRYARPMTAATVEASLSVGREIDPASARVG